MYLLQCLAVICTLSILPGCRALEVDKHFGAYRTGESRVIGGKDVDPPNKFSSIISLQFNNNRHVCAGTILNKRWVMTAQHCTLYPDSSLPAVSVVAGLHSLDKLDAPGVQRVKVVQVIRHPRFNQTYFPDSPPPFDISLLRVKPHFVFTNSVTPVNLPPLDFRVPKDFNITAIGVGWDNKHKILQEVELPLITTETCQRKLGYFLNPKPWDDSATPRNESWFITPWTLCAQTKEDGKGNCNGDSGGPLFIHDQEYDSFIQVGLVSAGVDCGKKEYPEVLTKISKMIQWIDSSILRCRPRLKYGG